MSAEVASAQPTVISDDAPPTAGAVAITSCSRLGRTANPPGFSLTDWLRPRRSR